MPRSLSVDADTGGQPGDAQVCLAGPDTVHLSADIAISEAVREQLGREEEAAQLAARGKAAPCPAWPGAQVLRLARRVQLLVPFRRLEHLLFSPLAPQYVCQSA